MELRRTLIDNSPEGYNMTEVLKECLKDKNVTEVYIATGFWDLRGTALVYDELAEFLKRDNSKFRLLIGKDPYLYSGDTESFTKGRYDKQEQAWRVDLDKFAAQEQYVNMATLKELYTTLKSLRDMNLPVDDKLLKAADNLEEKIIKEEILPALSQNIEPQLSEIQRELVLVVEYHPGEPLSVALSRKAKISEIIDAKTLTPKSNVPVSSAEKPSPADPHSPTKHVENPTKGLRVTFTDGTIIWHNAAINTFVDALRKIGLDRIPQVGIEHGGYNLVSKDKRPVVPGRIWQHEVDGWYIYSNISNEAKVDDLKRISDYYKLKLKIEEGKPEK